jgi:hypothetical protein
VDTHVSRIRNKLELSGKRGTVLKAVYHYGYRLDNPRPTTAITRMSPDFPFYDRFANPIN